MGNRSIIYTAHPTIRKFHQSPAQIKAIIGPVNSGSSSGCIMELWRAALEQEPNPWGVRQRKAFIGRGSYSQLKTTVRETIKNWFPENVLKLAGNAPIQGTLKCPHPDGKTTIEWTLVLHSIESADDFEEKAASFEVSDFWFNEFRFLPLNILSIAVERFGRFPPIIPHPDGPHLDPVFAGCSKKRIVMDSNMPDDDSHWHEYFEIKHKNDPNVGLFIQPGALLYNNEGELYENPEAENITYINGGYQYYWNKADNAVDIDEIKTKVCNMWGTSVSGLPVYGSDYYVDDTHYSKTDIEPNRQYPLIIGADWGVRYAGWVFAQYIDARLIVLDELLIEDMGTQEQLDDYVLPLLNTKYSGFKAIGWADPAGRARDDWEGKPLYMHVRQHTGIKFKLANTNRIKARVDAVKRVLRKPNGFILSNNIRWLRRGFKGHYGFAEKRVRTLNKEYKPEPEKTKESHPHDALQYIALNLNSPLLERLAEDDGRYREPEMLVVV